jgi:hypothetical protein
MSTELRFSYRPTFADNVLCAMAYLIRSKVQIVMNAIFWLAGIVILISSFYLYGAPRASDYLVATIALGFTPILLIIVTSIARVRSRGIDLTQHFRVDDSGIHVSGALSAVDLKWEAFKKAALGRRYLILFYKVSGGLVLPWRPLETAGVAAEFRAAVKRHIA